MKKRGLVIFLGILFLPGVVALSVSLNSPSSGNTTNMTSIIFSCTATETTYSISSISLYMNTSSSPWIQVNTQTNSSTSANFFISGLSQGAYIWNCFALNSNNDNVSASGNYSLTISTLAFSGIIANQTITEDTNSSTLFDLDTYFTGASYYTFSGNSSSIFIIDSNNQVSISPLANFTGSQNVTITGIYASSSKTSNEILINITNTNDAPLKTANISNIVLEKNANSTIDLKEYFTDIDPSANLSYSISAGHISLSQNGTIIILSPSTDWEGEETATITVSDGSASVTSNSFTITVGSAADNTPPSINSYSPDSNPTLKIGETQDFTLTISDSDGDTLTLAWYVNDEKQGDTDESLSFTSSEEGVFTIKGVVSDGTIETTQTWTVIVGDITIEGDSTLTEQSSSAVCGNNIIEDGENCSSCALDVTCESGYLCNKGLCKKKESALRAILILSVGTILILILAIGIYYFTILKKTRKSEQNTTFKYTPREASPPTDYTDLYKK